MNQNKEFHIEIISPEGLLFSSNCHLATIPAALGDMGIMADHEAVLAQLNEGKIEVFDEKNNILKEYSLKSGFAQFYDNKLLVLID
jgi:F-type H+-transporting ATPase subunit epsilon